MDKQTSWWRRHRPTKRRLVQLYTALLYNAHLKGFAQGEIYTGSSKALCVPGLNCYSCPAAVGACPLGALQNAVAASASRPGFYVVGLLLLFGLALGRVICGWACPMGLLQELLHQIPTPKLKKGRLTRALRWIKYILLGVLVLAVPLYYAFRRVPLPAFCKYVCPAGTLEGAIGLLLHPANRDKLGLLGLLFTRKFILLVLIALACVFLYRAFCRFICPLGALYGLMNRLALLGVKLDHAACTDCGACLRVCPMDIRCVGDAECISCGKCVGLCPTSAICFQAGRVRPSGQPAPAGGRKARVGFALLLAGLLLLGTLIAVNLPARGSVEATVESGRQTELEQRAELGCAVGQQLPDFRLTQSNGTEFELSAQRGKLVVLNLWATWCGPCVAELPVFADFALAHPDAAVLAIHSSLVTEDVQQWIGESELALSFALDESGAVSELLGASSMLPHTVILDPNGRVVYNRPGAVAAELLEDFYQKAK
ncbi:MAG: redoxin domain-containing protein [Oscillospiraceae bacterium]|nr:redoxin domain-containing protein [Oscillospiraceae bacterium]